MKTLNEMIDAFLTAYADAPLYGGYSRTLKRKIDGKQQIKLAFIENIQMIGKLSDDPKVSARVDAMLKKFE